MSNNFDDKHHNSDLELPIDQIIGNPFYAAINAQSNIGKLSLKFINQLGFDNQDSNQVSYLEFNSIIPEKNDNGSIIENPFKIKLPILTIINLPNFYLSNIEVDFNMMITKKEKDIVYGNLISDSDKIRNFKNPTYKLKIQAKNDTNLPLGLQKTIKLFDNLSQVSTDYLRKTIFRIINVINVIPNEFVEFQINPNLLDLEYVFENRNKFIDKPVTISGIKDDSKDYYNGKTSIKDIKFLDIDKKIIINDFRKVKYLFLTIDKKHYQINENKQIVEKINSKIQNLNYQINKLKLKKETPLKYCKSDNITERDEKLSISELEYMINSFEGSNKGRKLLENKLNLAISFINNLENNLKEMDNQIIEYINKKKIIIDENNLNNILTKNRVNGCLLIH